MSLITVVYIFAHMAVDAGRVRGAAADRPRAHTPQGRPAQGMYRIYLPFLIQSNTKSKTQRYNSTFNAQHLADLTVAKANSDSTAGVIDGAELKQRLRGAHGDPAGDDDLSQKLGRSQTLNSSKQSIFQ